MLLWVRVLMNLLVRCCWIAGAAWCIDTHKEHSWYLGRYYWCPNNWRLKLFEKVVFCEAFLSSRRNYRGTSMFKTVSKPLAHLNFLSCVNCYVIGSITNQRRCFAKKLEAQEGLKKKFDQEVVSAKNSEKLYAQLFPKMMFNRILCITAIRRRVTRIFSSS